MCEGWVKIHRKILEWEWFQDHKTFSVFIYLVLSANHKDKKWEGKVIKRGQVVTGRKKIALDCKVSERSVRTILKRLKSTNEITIESTNRFSIVTICNFNTYQINEKNIAQEIDQEHDQQPTSNRPATDHKQELKNDKNIKKEKLKKEKKLREAAEKKKREKEIENLKLEKFEIFWDLYDKKTTKQETLPLWLKLSLDEIETVLKAVPAWVEAKEKNYRPDPVRFIRNGRWKDEVIMPESPNEKIERENKKILTERMREYGVLDE